MAAVEIRVASAAELHRVREPVVDDVLISLCEPTRPALVLGSRQPVTDELVVRCERASLDVVRRRSGGGAVLVHPTSSLWIDVYIAAGGPCWDSEPVATMRRVGSWWKQVLDRELRGSRELRLAVGNDDDAGRGAMVCFAGRVCGEVLEGDAKLVGCSQRRSRTMIRVQCQVHSVDPTDQILALLGVDEPSMFAPGGIRRPSVLGVNLDHADRVRIASSLAESAAN